MEAIGGNAIGVEGIGTERTREGLDLYTGTTPSMI